MSNETNVRIYDYKNQTVCKVWKNYKTEGAKLNGAIIGRNINKFNGDRNQRIL